MLAKYMLLDVSTPMVDEVNEELTLISENPVMPDESLHVLNLIELALAKRELHLQQADRSQFVSLFALDSGFQGTMEGIFYLLSATGEETIFALQVETSTDGMRIEFDAELMYDFETDEDFDADYLDDEERP